MICKTVRYDCRSFTKEMEEETTAVETYCSQCGETEFAVAPLDENEIKTLSEITLSAVLGLLEKKGITSLPILKYFTEDLVPVKCDSQISIMKLKEIFNGDGA